MKSLAKKTNMGWAIYYPDLSLECSPEIDSESPRITPYCKSPEELARYCSERRILTDERGEYELIVFSDYEKWLKLIKEDKIKACVVDARTGECCDK